MEADKSFTGRLTKIILGAGALGITHLLELRGKELSLSTHRLELFGPNDYVMQHQS